MLEVITGPMLSGKSEELIRRVHRCQYARQSLLVLHHSLDTRYNDSVASHNGIELTSTAVQSAAFIPDFAQDVDVLAIDEAQFFDDQLPDVLNDLAQTKRVIAAGLNTDYLGQPFGPMPTLLALADHVTTLTAICTECGQEATRTQRLTDSNEQIMVGGKDKHDARCRACHHPSS